ncbi:hypothetical protein [Desulfovibrio sp. Huiquan2017]|uniref:hypothetical protein n=1 Tax=Desulfovibrio sp. Huiquan2017 TaxID=2816861 RepID=UPI001A928B17|nr:hypothetical protein [Desulfovibrio sp. Huiquan2017]
MRDFWTFIGGVAVGILAATGVFAMEEDSEPLSAQGDREGLDDENEEEADDDDRLIVRPS